MKIAALILAAGKGKRMHSHRPKVLQTLLGQPLLAHVLRSLRTRFQDKIWTIVGHGSDAIRQCFKHENLQFIEQRELKGTGHAVLQALPTLIENSIDYVLVVNGDTPLLTADAVQKFLNDIELCGHKAIAFASIDVPFANNYGRVLRDSTNNVVGIVEAKDYDEAVHGKVSNEVNAGLYFMHVPTLTKLLPLLSSNNKSAEYYLTDIIHLGIEHGYDVHGVECGEDAQLLGVNSPAELIKAEEILRKSLVENFLESGVIIHNPQMVSIGAEVQIMAGAEIFGPCEIYGNSSIAKGAVIKSHCVLDNAIIAEEAIILSFSHIQDAYVGQNVSVGPYARLRPGAKLEEKCKVGNFVEIKKSTVHKGAKVSHLSYIGDADIGEDANIGAGTITCNYDGKNKFKTEIGANAFIGSNTALVAPVRIGDNALVGAGSVITNDVPSSNLAIGRARQNNIPKRK